MVKIEEDITESEVVFNCMDLLGSLAIFCWRNNTGALRNKHNRLIHYGYPGSSDILGILPDGKLLAVECKRPSGGRISELQKSFTEKINRCHGLACIVTSHEELLQELKNAGYVRELAAAGV